MTAEEPERQEAPNELSPTPCMSLQMAGVTKLTRGSLRVIFLSGFTRRQARERAISVNDVAGLCRST